MKSCRVISTYFGPRRKNVGFSDTISTLKEVIKLEQNDTSGVEKDTIIVNHDFGDIMGKKFLDTIDGTKTKDGIFKILHRPFDNGIGGSFCSFNYAYEKFRNDYEYWFFNEDDVVVVKENYMTQIINQLKSDSTIAFICAQRETQTIQDGYIIKTGAYEPHAHGGTGGTHVKFLNECYDKYGKLPYSEMPMTDDMILAIKDGDSSAFNSQYARDWYRSFEIDGEIRFTNVYIKDFGYNLQNIISDEPVVYNLSQQKKY